MDSEAYLAWFSNHSFTMHHCGSGMRLSTTCARYRSRQMDGTSTRRLLVPDDNVDTVPTRELAYAEEPLAQNHYRFCLAYAAFV